MSNQFGYAIVERSNIRNIFILLSRVYSQDGGALFLSLIALYNPRWSPAVLHWAQQARSSLRPQPVIVPEAGIEHEAELGHRRPRPVPMAKELVLGLSEEPINSRATGRVAPSGPS